MCTFAESDSLSFLGDRLHLLLQLLEHGRLRRDAVTPAQLLGRELLAIILLHEGHLGRHSTVGTLVGDGTRGGQLAVIV